MDHCDQGKLNIPRKPQHGLNFEYMRDTIKTTNSKAALAVIDAFEKTLMAVLEKHPKRGDAWVDSFTISTCVNLAGAKLDRIEMLLDKMGDFDEEMDEEAVDAIAYIAFGLWMIGKL